MTTSRPKLSRKQVRLAVLARKLSLTKVNWSLLALIAGGLVAFGYYLSWWLVPQRLASPWYLAGFFVMLAFAACQVLSHWLLYLLADWRPRRVQRATTHYLVDVFVTACGEDPRLVRKCLAAACAMRGNKRVWLLDDGHDPRLEQLAADLGAGYLARPGRKDAKAGNLNYALARTHGEIIAVFDVDHVPVPGYLEATLYHFDDPSIGFVQVMLTFHENGAWWVEQAAAESSYPFYNPTSIGMDTLGSVTMMGSNSLLRRSALLSIGNYQPGLAEDLATSLALHSRGWRSAYVAEPLAPGLAPPDLSAWFTQQFKWARGVFEVLITTAPRVWSRLGWGGRLAYTVRLTMYWLGPALFLHLLATIGVLLFADRRLVADYEAYLIHLAPLACFNVLIHGNALKRWLHPALATRGIWHAMVLVFATWPIYTLAWIMALLRIPLAFRLTPKQATGTLPPHLLVPQFLMLLILVAAAADHLARPGEPSYLVPGIALVLAVPHFLFFWLHTYAPARRSPAALMTWDDATQGE